MKKPLLALIAVAAFAVGLFAAVTLTGNKGVFSEAHGTVVPLEKGKFGGDFTLQQGDNPVQLKDFQGKIVVFYFGYASCPDVCPTTLSIIGSALKKLKPAEQEQVQPLFISVDPERDQGEKLQAYAKHFHPSFIGLTADPDTVQQVASQYGAFYAKVESDSALGYLVDHSSKTYLVSKDGQYAKILPHDMRRADLLASIREAL